MLFGDNGSDLRAQGRNAPSDVLIHGRGHETEREAAGVRNLYAHWGEPADAHTRDRCKPDAGLLSSPLF